MGGKKPSVAEQQSAATRPPPPVPSEVYLTSVDLWLSTSVSNERHVVYLNKAFGPGVTLQTSPFTTDGAVATCGEGESPVVLLPGPQGELEVVPGGAYDCVRIFDMSRQNRHSKSVQQ